MRAKESRLFTALQLAVIASLVAGAIALFPQREPLDDAGDRTPVGSNKLNEFSTNSPSKLESQYRESWRVVRDNYIDIHKLVGFQQWEHKFDGTIFTRSEMTQRIDEMLASLGDQRTIILAREELDGFDQQLETEINGVGLTIDKDGVIQAVLPGSPAEKEGLHVGDIVTDVDGSPFKALAQPGIGLDTKGAKLAVKRRTPGAPGPYLALRTRFETREVTLTPRTFKKLEAVTFALDERVGSAYRVGYIRINSLRCDDTVNAVSDRLLQMETANAAVAIIDLTGQKGGKLNVAARLAGLFVPDGLVVQSYRREEGGQPYQESYTVRGGKVVVTSTPFRRTVEPLQLPPGRWLTKPVFVIIDGETEGTAELLAVALQGNKRAQLVGQPSAGKHCGQRVFTTSFGLLLQVTTCRTSGPDGKLLAPGSVKPDILVEPKGDAYAKAVATAFGIK